MHEKRIVALLPPGAGLRLGTHGSAFSLPLWVYWVEIARQQVEVAREHSPSDELIDAISAHAPDRPDESAKRAGQETYAAMIAVTAAGFALDGFYGSVKPLVNPPPSKAARERQVLECLKLGFKLGQRPTKWLQELDWLFAARRNAVHHSEKFEPTVVVRATAETVVAGGPETFNYSVASAERAHGLASEIIQTCLDNPKAVTREWADQRREALRKIANPQRP